MQEQSIPLEIAQEGINWYFSTNESRHIRFYGPGEPTQEFEKMKAITEFAKGHRNRGDEVTVEIQTNGVFVPSIREWILENVNIVWMSFDGMRDIQEHFRPLNPKYASLYDGKSSACVLEENVQWLINHRRENANLMVGARVTITDYNVRKQREMVDYFYELGIRYVWTDTVFYSVGKKPVCDDNEKKKIPYSVNIEEYVNHYLEAFEYAKTKGMFWGSFYMINFDGSSPYHCRCCTPLQAPHLTTDGYVSACDMVLFGKEANHMSQFIVGKWDPSKRMFVFFEDRIEALNDRKSTQMEHCSNCAAKLHCGGQCLGEIVNEFGILDGQNIDKCYAVRQLYEVIGNCAPFPYFHP